MRGTCVQDGRHAGEIAEGVETITEGLAYFVHFLIEGIDRAYQAKFP